jgi:hypothetical protein
MEGKRGMLITYKTKMMQIFRKFTCFMAYVINQVEMLKHTCGRLKNIKKKTVVDMGNNFITALRQTKKNQWN